MGFVKQSAVTAICERCGDRQSYSNEEAAEAAGWRKVSINQYKNFPQVRLVCNDCRLSLSTWFRNDRPDPIDRSVDHVRLRKETHGYRPVR
jgi:hypothetical protein